ncbi:ion channel [Chloroflexota bacterium]
MPRLLRVLYALAAIVVIGISGYMLIERWSFLDALYMTIITITTVGYNEVNELSTGG